MLLTLMTAQAQTVLTEEQQLEQAQKQLEAAKKALEVAKLKAQAAKLKAQADSINAANAKMEADAKKADAEAKKAEAEAKKATQSAEPRPVVVKEPTTSANGWAIPVAATASKATEKKSTTLSNGVVAKVDPKYLEGAITTNAEGKIEFILDTDCNGKSAQQIYDIVLKYMTSLTQGDQNISSRVALVNPQEHIIANTMDEWLVFNQSFISLDRTEFKYQLVAKISDNHLHLTIGRINYDYEKGRSTGFKDAAENVISDKVALTKKKNDLAKIFGKFRRLTIDRKDQIFKEIKMLVID